MKYVIQVHDYIVGPFGTHADAISYLASDPDLPMSTPVLELVSPERDWKRKRGS